MGRGEGGGNAVWGGKRGAELSPTQPPVVHGATAPAQLLTQSLCTRCPHPSARFWCPGNFPACLCGQGAVSAGDKLPQGVPA